MYTLIMVKIKCNKKQEIIGENLMRDKIVLIDGHSILNRAFYGVPDLTNSEGLHTNAVYEIGRAHV